MLSFSLHKTVRLNFSALALISLSATLITGCGANFVSNIASTNPALHPPIYGNLHGGQQPVVGASIQLYAAGAPAVGGGYGEGSVPLILTSPLPITDQNGNFTITGDYVAPLTPSFFYIVANGGKPGVGQPINPNITMMTTIGGCNPTVGLSPSTSVEINEVTTAATALALQQYLAAPSLTNVFSPAIGAPSTDIIGLQNAFQSVNNLVSTETGDVVDPATNVYASSDNGILLNTMGDILASCVNSAPLLDTSCFNLYANATPTGLVFPSTDTDQAASYMARNPTNNVPALFGLIPAKPPFIAASTAPAAFAVNLANLHSSCQAPINLNTLDHFELLAGSNITAAAGGLTTITGGDIGLSPGTAVTGFPPAILTTPAVMYLTDPIAAQAQLDLTTVYNQVAGLPGAAPLPADISGYILPPGLYSTTATLAFNNNITLDAQGDPNAQFIFQVASGLNTGLDTQIILINGAQAKNVFWQIGSSAVLGHDSIFQGSIFAYASITLNIDVVVHGRALASNGAVTMSGNNTVVAP
jgi:hypothetical protein